MLEGVEQLALSVCQFVSEKILNLNTGRIKFLKLIVVLKKMHLYMYSKVVLHSAFPAVSFNVRTVRHFNTLDTVEPGICRIDACRSTKYFRYGGGVRTYTESTHSPQVISLPYLTPPHMNKIYVHVQVWVSIIQSTGYKLLMVQPCVLNNAHHSAPQHLHDP